MAVDLWGGVKERWKDEQRLVWTDIDAPGGRGVTVDLRAELLVAAGRGDDDPRPALDTAPIIHSHTIDRTR